MILPQTSFETAQSVAAVLRKEGYAVVIRQDAKSGWVVEITSNQTGASS